MNQHPFRLQKPSKFPVRIGILAFLWCLSIVITVLLAIFFTHLGYSQNYIAKDNLYQVSGLSESRESRLFQDFAPRNTSTNNVNVVSWIWADSFRKSSIRTFVINEQPEKTHSNYLRILFENKTGWSSNVAIRPKYEMALRVPKGYSALQFDGRIPTNGEGVTKTQTKEKLVINIRVVDRHLTYWEYKQSPRHFLTFEIEPDNQWETFTVNLEDKSKWTLFEPAGNYKYAAKSPDFSIITAVVIVVGKEGDNGAFGGSGTIDIANVRLAKPL